MKAIDFSRETWQSIRERIVADREEVWHAWQRFGPGTTEAVASRANWSILRFRPRTTELLQAGFVALVDRDKEKKAGVYRACTEAEALNHFREAQGRMTHGQLSLGV